MLQQCIFMLAIFHVKRLLFLCFLFVCLFFALTAKGGIQKAVVHFGLSEQEAVVL